MNQFPVEKPAIHPWNDYQRAGCKSQIAAGIITLISGVAIGILLALHPHGISLLAADPSLIVFGAVGGGSLVVFVVCTCMNRISIKNMKQTTQETEIEEEIKEEDIQQNDVQEEEHIQEEKIHQEDEIKDNSEEKITPPPSIGIDEQPIEYFKKVLISPLMKVSEEVVHGIAKANAKKTGEELPNEKNVRKTFNNLNTLLNKLIDNPTLYATELLRYYGKGTSSLTVGLRRLVAAHNSGDSSKFAKINDEFDAIKRGNDLTPLATAMKPLSNDQLMKAFPELLQKHCTLTDSNLQNQAKEILIHIFYQTKNNPNVLNKLNSLRKSSNLARDVENFVKYVFEQAAVPKNVLEEWNKKLIKYMVDVHFLKSTCSVLSMMARNIKILKMLFNKDTDKKALFTLLDETFLISESSDCIMQGRDEFRKEMLKIQSELNFTRAGEKRVALIVLSKEEKREYPVLMQNIPVIKTCCERNPHDASELTKLSDSKPLIEFGKKHGVRIVVAPVSMNDHPFKSFKNHETTLRFVAKMAKPFLLTIFDKFVKPKVLEVFPKMNDNESKEFDSIFTTLLNLMIGPLYNGVINNNAFTPIFQNIITVQGEQLAEKLENLVNDKTLNYDEVGEVWTEAMKNVANAFSQVK